MALVRDVQLVTVMVAAGDGDDFCPVADRECQFLLGIIYPTAFLVDGIDAYMLQVHSIGFPFAVVGKGNQFHGLARSFNLMAGNFFG